MHAKSQWVSQSVLSHFGSTSMSLCDEEYRQKVMNFLPNYTPQEDKNSNQTNTNTNDNP